MLARDTNASPVQYRTWVVNDQPDFTGQFYTGDKSGPTPFVDVSAYAIFNPGEVVDFNLPDPLNWSPTFRVLPSYICDSQVAVVDGYLYLFGGQNTANIFRASVNNPADWVNTGAILPTPLAGSQLAIIDGYLYLFGGTTDAHFSSATDTIFSAPISNPLNWTNNGHLLPRKLHHSQLAVIDGYVYLFGGNENSNASSAILRASVSNPLLWSDTGLQLTDPLYGSQLGIVDGYTYLFGGLTSSDAPTSSIYQARTSNPLVWKRVSALPYPAFYGQFCTLGDQGFLITPSNSPLSFTRIFRCQLSNPLSWVDTLSTVDSVASQSQLAIIYDRLFLYGGNGSTVILANDQIVKYKLDIEASFTYGNVTRTQVHQAPNRLSLFQVLGFRPWVSDYGSF